jgi:hypothetical protein
LLSTRFSVDCNAIWTVCTADGLGLRDGNSGSGGRDLSQHPVPTEVLLGCERVMRGAAHAKVGARRRPAAARRDWKVIELH